MAFFVAASDKAELPLARYNKHMAWLEESREHGFSVNQVMEECDMSTRRVSVIIDCACMVYLPFILIDTQDKCMNYY